MPTATPVALAVPSHSMAALTYQRLSRIAVRLGEGRLTESDTGRSVAQQERVFMPLFVHSVLKVSPVDPDFCRTPRRAAG